MSKEFANKTKRSGNKKNKKRKFLQNAKGFAKRDIFGRGTRIENDEYQYFIKVLDTIREKFEDTEDKVNMANNVFDQMKGREVYLASNQIVCKVMESLVGFVDAEQLESFLEIFSGELRPVCSNPYASHVLQKLVETAFLRSISKDKLITDNSETKELKTCNYEAQPAKKLKLENDVLSEEDYNLETVFNQQHKTNCGKFVLLVGKFVLNNLEDFVYDTYASHIIRSCLYSLAGIYVPKVAFEKAVSATKNKIYEVPTEWHDVCKEFAERLQMWPQFSELAYKDTSSALLSVLCTAIKAIDKKMLRNLGKKILMEALLQEEDPQDEVKDTVEDEEQEKIEDDQEEEKKEDKTNGGLKSVKAFQHKPSLFLLETLIEVAGPKLFQQIYNTLFANKLPQLVVDPLVNHSVKRILKFVKEKEEFENMFDELQEHIETLLNINYFCIITTLSAGCLRFQTKQSQLITALQTAFHLSDNKEHLKSFFLCLLKLKPIECLDKEKPGFVHLQGSLLIQDLLRFNKPIFLVNCILEASPEFLVTVFNTPNGSHICDHFLKSKFIGEKSRDKLIKHLEGFYMDLAVTRCGSRVIESCFASAQDSQKELIVKELARKSLVLKSTQYGAIVSQKFRVDTYNLSANQWKAGFQRKEKAQELFKDIIN